MYTHTRKATAAHAHRHMHMHTLTHTPIHMHTRKMASIFCEWLRFGRPTDKYIIDYFSLTQMIRWTHPLSLMDTYIYMHVHLGLYTYTLYTHMHSSTIYMYRHTYVYIYIHIYVCVGIYIWIVAQIVAARSWEGWMLWRLEVSQLQTLRQAQVKQPSVPILLFVCLEPLLVHVCLCVSWIYVYPDARVSVYVLNV